MPILARWFGGLRVRGADCNEIYLRRLRGSRFARAAEDNAASQRSCSGSNLRWSAR